MPVAANIETGILTACMAMVLFYTGLLFDLAAFRKQLRRSSATEFARLLLANYVIIPTITLFSVWLFSFPPTLALVLLTLALLPCAPLVPALVSVSGRSPEWPIFVFLTLSILNLTLVPIFMAALSMPWAAGLQATLGDGDRMALLRYFVSVYGPMGLGAAMTVLAPRSAARASKGVRRGLPIVLLAAFVLFIVSHHAEMLSLGWHGLGALAVFEMICATVALLLQPSKTTDRTTLVLICSFRNFAMGIAFTAIVFPHTSAPTYMMAYSSLIILAVMIGLALKAVAATARQRTNDAQ